MFAEPVRLQPVSWTYAPMLCIARELGEQTARSYPAAACEFAPRVLFLTLCNTWAQIWKPGAFLCKQSAMRVLTWCALPRPAVACTGGQGGVTAAASLRACTGGVGTGACVWGWVPGLHACVWVAPLLSSCLFSLRGWGIAAQFPRPLTTCVTAGSKLILTVCFTSPGTRIPSYCRAGSGRWKSHRLSKAWGVRGADSGACSWSR